MPDPLLIAVGLVILVTGAEVMLRGGSRLAARFGISPIVIGLTVVAIGTSLPELIVGIDAVYRDSPGLAIGNIVGTNLVNLLLILGLSAVILPVAVESRTIRFDLPAIGVTALVLLVMALDGDLSRWEGVVLVIGAVAYTAVIVRTSRREPSIVAAEFRREYQSVADDDEPDFVPPPRSPGTVADVARLVLGIVVVVIGGDLLVDGSIGAARDLGVGDELIGLTVVAIGTSSPELVTVLVSTLRGDRSIAVGNLLGSSVYNIMLILGLTMVAAPDGISVPEQVRRVDLTLMTLVALACLPIFRSGGRMSRREGTVFVLSYVAFLGYLLLART